MRRLPHVAGVLSLIVLAACGSPSTQRVIWSPDGARALLVTHEGLRVCDAPGTLSPLLARDVYDAAWLGDSRRVIVARSREVTSLAALQDALGPRRAADIAAGAESVWQQMQAPAAPMPLDARLNAIAMAQPSLYDDADAILLYLNERHADALPALLGADWTPDLLEATVHELFLARLTGDGLEPGASLHRDLSRIHQIVPSPGGRTVAFVIETQLGVLGSRSLRSLLAVPADGSAAAALLAGPDAMCPAWTADGRSLVYLAADPTEMVHRLGAIVAAELQWDEHGGIETVNDATELVQVLMRDTCFLAWLPDGRLLFDSVDLQLPGTNLTGRFGLFVFDGDTKEAVPAKAQPPRERPDGLEYSRHFRSRLELSPDATQVLFAGAREVVVMTVADGTIERLPQGETGFDDPQRPLPAWRRPGEFTYLKRQDGRNELVLRRNGAETVLSRDWPEDMLQPSRP